MKIAIDAGHGINTAGKRTPDNIHEWTLNAKVATYLQEYLKGYATTIRTDDITGKTDIGLTTRRNKAINNGCDLLVSIHHNATSGKWNNATGIEVYYATLFHHKRAKEIANKIAPKLAAITGLKNRGVRTANFTVISTSKIPAVLCEGGFMDGQKDSYYIRTEAGQKAYAKAVAEVIIEYYGLKKSTNTSSSNQTTIKKEEFEVAKTYKNGSTVEAVYADTNLTKKTGSLSKNEVCECLGIVNGRYLVKYKVTGTSNYKCGFVKYNGGIK